MTNPDSTPLTANAPTTVGPATLYQVVALFGLCLLCFGQYRQGLEVPNLLLAALAGWMLLFPRPRLPLAFAVIVAFVQAMVHSDRYHSFGSSPQLTLFEPTETAIAAGLLLFLACQYRLISIRWHAAPYDPRVTYRQAHDGGGRPVAQFNRPDHVVRPEEIVRLLMVATLCVVAGQVEWVWLNQNWSVNELSPRFMRFAFLVWFGILTIFAFRGLASIWRRAHSDPDEARMYLQEIAWREARREYGRIGRWIAWGKSKVLKKMAKAAAKK